MPSNLSVVMTTNCQSIAGLALFALISTGCRNDISHDLQGRWIGKPDTAAKRVLREQRRYRLLDSSGSARKQNPSLQSGSSSLEPREPGASEGQALDAEQFADNDLVEVTDWEKLEVEFFFHFHGDGQIDMSLADGGQTRTGKWRVVQQTPATVLIEIETRSGTSEPDDPNTGPTERRRFELLPDYEADHCVGFLFREMDADPLLGSLYFTRQE